MKVTLLNFGINDRGVPNLEGVTQLIAVGGSAVIDIHKAHFDLIKIEMERPEGTLFLMPEGTQPPPELYEVVRLLSGIESMDYDVLLAGCNEVLGRDANDLRPTRYALRDKLKDVALRFVRGDDVPAQAGKQFIKEEGDPADLAKELGKPATPAAPAAPDPMKDRPAPIPAKDAALSLALGEEEPKAPPARVGRVRAPEPAPAPAKAKGKAKAKAPAKKPVGRVRASA